MGGLRAPSRSPSRLAGHHHQARRREPEPRNSLVKQYQKLFKLEKVKLNFTDDALRAIAEKAIAKKAGARGLRSILESVMLDLMYEVPSQEDVKEVTITEEMVNGGAAVAVEQLRDYGVPG